MYKIEKAAFGFRLTFGGSINEVEMEQWLKESEDALRPFHREFGVLVDMKTLEPLGKEAQAVMVQGQSLYRLKGMRRSAVILNDPILTLQFRRLAKQSGIYTYERYLDASSDPDFQKHAEGWVKFAIDPDKLWSSRAKAALQREDPSSRAATDPLG